MNCAICGSELSLSKERTDRRFRKESFTIIEHFYKCNKCGEEVTTTELDRLNLIQVYNQYRENHNILCPEQIKSIREEYGLSAIKMSDLLGFGINSIGNYEKGEIPNNSNSTLFNLIRDPKNFKNLIENKKDLFSLKDLERLYKIIDRKITELSSFYIKNIYWDNTIIPNRFTGYKSPNFKKFAFMVIFFITKAKPFITKLNKLLFYADFMNFKNYGVSISGTSYRAIQMGPVPEYYGIFYDLMESEDLIEREFIEFNNCEGSERFVNKTSFKKEAFSPEEFESLNQTINKFSNLSTHEMVRLSHEEIGWQKNVKDKNLISYQDYAFDLKGI